MPPMTHDALWESGYDEPVEVNQRALIDKVLARYSAEFTVFRELLQNSDDAKSTAVQIRFETPEHHSTLEGQSTLPDLKKVQAARWIFKNNGDVFTQADWSRLKKIADGNPDEDKIGAFGVGFYSLFSETDEPRVRSGDQWMCFYWKDGQDQLFVRRGKDVEYSPDATEQWTTFDMPLRDPSTIPVPFDFARFLASSITFMTHLNEVSVFVDDYRIIKLSRTVDVPKSVPMPAMLKTVSTNGYMKGVGLQCKPVEIKAELMRAVYTSGTEKPPPPSSAEVVTKQAASGLFKLGRSLFGGWGSSPATSSISLPVTPEVQPAEPDPTTVHETSVLLSMYSVDIAVTLGKKLAGELQRSTKKEAPHRMKYELIYTGKDQYDASTREDEALKFSTGSVFQALRADLDRGGFARIFIGHATAQTTGIGGNMSARFIPTVEREQLDLSNKYVGDWNKELLWIGGLLCRAAYEVEVKAIKSLWDAAAEGNIAGPSPEVRTLLTARYHHVLKFFTFRETTPQSEVRAGFEQAFFRCSLTYFPIMSTVGIRNASEVVMPSPAFASFLKETAFLPESLVPAPGELSMIHTIRQGPGWLKEIRPEDVIKELDRRPLNEEEMVACLKWWCDLVKRATPAQSNEMQNLRQKLLEVAILKMGPSGTGSGQETILPLSLVKRFLITKGITAHIPLDGPLPDDLLPISVSQKFKAEELKAGLRWQELTIVTWLTYVLSTSVMNSNPAYDITLSAPWAEKVFTILARAWSTLSRSDMELAISLLHNHACVPTTSGMQVPASSYFSSVNVFKDLPIVALPSGTAVKGHLEQVLLALGVRKHVDIQIVFDRMVKTNEWSAPELCKYFANMKWIDYGFTPIFMREKSADMKEKSPRHTASQLHEPLEVFREMKLPVVDWGTAKWRPTSDEARFLFKLGLRRQVDLDLLINTLCVHAEESVRKAAFKYLLENIEVRYINFDAYKYGNVAFVPAIHNSVECLATPSEVSTDSKWSIMNFKIVQPHIEKDAIAKLKLQQHPPVILLMNLLKSTPPKDVEQARQWFSVLAGRTFVRPSLRNLVLSLIVPIEEKGVIRRVAPRQCFFNNPRSASFHSSLFTFIDFGTKGNTFLSACGTQREPSVEQLALKLLENPLNFYKLTGGPQNYYRELTNIAVNQRGLRRAPALLANRRKPSEKDDDDDEANREYDLKTPGEIVIVDDANAYQLFGDKLWTAPPEEMLEEFYGFLGFQIPFCVYPLFLHEHSHSSRTRISIGWLGTEGNFIVKSYGTIQTVKTLNFGSVKESKTLNASAAAHRARAGAAIELWLANNDEPDMYECHPKAHDALLFMTILSTDLRSLSRRGYNVQWIEFLRQQKAQRQAREEELRKEREREKEKAQATKLLSETQPPISHSAPPAIPPKDTRPQLQQPLDGPSSNKRASSILKKFSDKLGGQKPPVGKSTSSQATFYETGKRMTQVREALDEGYCDISGRVGDLKFVGQMHEIKIYCSEEVPSPHTFVPTNKDALGRLINLLLLPLGQVYGMPRRSLHVFQDLEGGLIAFNRNGSIFINFRYYAAWHDKQVQANNLTPAYISLYFTLAHELAHNLVGPHNAEHEFYFSAICEKFLSGFIGLIGSA
ncbi:hypothetical protein DL96DRAFT_1603553 [Flagelloscypha sp. PMI_526]|nr:hypothetical protein DL96DRAFT_1603553 [Flagelloscypha sp. PMI_526]